MAGHRSHIAATKPYRELARINADQKERAGLRPAPSCFGPNRFSFNPGTPQHPDRDLAQDIAHFSGAVMGTVSPHFLAPRVPLLTRQLVSASSTRTRLLTGLLNWRLIWKSTP